MKMLNMEFTKELQFSSKLCQEKYNLTLYSEWGIGEAPLEEGST